MKTFSLFSLMALAVLALCPLAVMPAAAQAELSAEPAAAPRTGVRFVVLSPTGETIPSPLYCLQGKAFVPVRIGARTPSPRVKPEAGGVVRFWKEDPMAAAAAAADASAAKGGKGGKAGKRPVAAAAAVIPAQLPDPFMTVRVPGGAGAETLCILVPNAEGKAQTFFVNESDVPMSGVHVINFSPYPLQMVLSKKGDFSDKVTRNIGFFQRSEGITEKNRWSYTGENGESVAFMLMCKTGKDQEFRRVRVSRFAVSNRQSQISVVVKDAAREGVKMLSIQLTDPKTGR